ILGMRVKLFRRLHRKLVVVDGMRAFVGGINYSADHLEDYGPEAKQDYALEIEGPLVDEIHTVAHSILPSATRRHFRRPRPPEPAGRRPADPRVLRPPAAWQGRAGRPGLVHRRLEQPRPAQPVAEPGGQRDHPPPRLQRRVARTHAAPDPRRLPAGRARPATA